MTFRPSSRGLLSKPDSRLVEVLEGGGNARNAGRGVPGSLRFAENSSRVPPAALSVTPHFHLIEKQIDGALVVITRNIAGRRARHAPPHSQAIVVRDLVGSLTDALEVMIFLEPGRATGQCRRTSKQQQTCDNTADDGPAGSASMDLRRNECGRPYTLVPVRRRFFCSERQ